MTGLRSVDTVLCRGMDKKRRCGILMAVQKGGHGHEHGENRGVSGVAAKGTGHDPAAGSGYIRCVQQNRQQVGVRGFT